MAAVLFDFAYEVPPLVELLAHVDDGLLEHDALGPPLALQSRHELGQPVEAFADGLASLLLWVAPCAVS